MASFDIISAAGFCYRTAWRERRYLIRLATVPLFIKLLCYQVIVMLGWQDNFIRQAVVMLPSFLADGWMLAHFVRLIYLGQRWPFRPAGNAGSDAAVLHDRAQGVFGGMLIFTLTQFLFTGLIEIAWRTNQMIETAEKTQDHVPAAVAFAGMGFFMASIWAFRLLWLYIPAAVSYSPRQALNDLKGYSTSFPMIGLWLACFAPAFAVFSVTATAMVAPYVGVVPALPPLVELSISFFRASVDTLVAVLATGGMAYGLRAMSSSGRDRTA